MKKAGDDNIFVEEDENEEFEYTDEIGGEVQETDDMFQDEEEDEKEDY